MKTKLFYTFFAPLFLLALLLPNAFAQDYTQLNLPDGAKARLGKGVIIDIRLSRDNKRLVISTSAGIWLYDVSVRAQITPLIKFYPQTVSQIAFSPDSKILALSAYDKTIRLWNAATGENRLKFDTPDGPFKVLKFSPDGKILIGQNWQGAIWFWDTTNGEQLIAFNPNLPKLNPRKYKNWNLAADFYVDHTGDVIFAVGNKDGTISIRNGKTDREIRKLISRTDDSKSLPIQYLRPYYPNPDVRDGGPYIKWVNTLYFAPDGKTLVSMADYRRARWDGWEGKGGPIEIWDVNAGEQLAFLQWGLDITFLGDGKTVAVSDEGDYVLWDIPSRRKIAEFQDVKIRFSGDGKTLAIIDNNGFKIWDIATQREIAAHSQIIEWLETAPERFVLSHDGTILATADRNGIVALWETQNTKQLRCLLTGWTNPFTALASSHDGKTLASGGGGNIQLWDVHSGRKRSTIKAKGIDNLVFTKDNATLISEGKISKSESNIEVRNVLTGEQIDVFTVPNTSRNDHYIGFGDGTVFSIHDTSMFSPNGEKLAIETKDGIEIWDVPINKHSNTLTQVRSRFNAWAFTPDGKILAVSMGSAVRLWNTQTGKEFTTLKTPKGIINGFLETLRWRRFDVYALAFAPDGNTLAAGGQDKKIYLWDISTKRHITTLKHEYAVSKFAFSPDGKILASGDTSGKIHLWEFATGHLLTTYNGHGNHISELSFAPDGKTLASVSGGVGFTGYNSGTIFLWNVPSK